MNRVGVRALHKQQQQYEKLIAKGKAWTNGLKESSLREQHRLEKILQTLSTELHEVKGYRSRGVSHQTKLVVNPSVDGKHEQAITSANRDVVYSGSGCGSSRNASSEEVFW